MNEEEEFLDDNASLRDVVPSFSSVYGSQVPALLEAVPCIASAKHMILVNN